MFKTEFYTELKINHRGKVAHDKYSKNARTKGTKYINVMPHADYQQWATTYQKVHKEKKETGKHIILNINFSFQ